MRSRIRRGEDKDRGFRWLGIAYGCHHTHYLLQVMMPLPLSSWESLCVMRSIAEAEKVALFYTWKTFQKKPLHSQNKEPRRTQVCVCVCQLGVWVVQKGSRRLESRRNVKVCHYSALLSRMHSAQAIIRNPFWLWWQNSGTKRQKISLIDLYRGRDSGVTKTLSVGLKD